MNTDDNDPDDNPDVKLALAYERDAKIDEVACTICRRLSTLGPEHCAVMGVNLVPTSERIDILRAATRDVWSSMGPTTLEVAKTLVRYKLIEHIRGTVFQYQATPLGRTWLQVYDEAQQFRR